MSLRIYNSLTNKKEEFVPLAPGKVGMYVCGITVYDECHIGHARSLFVFDVIRRYLTYKDYQVTYVRNITDVDDKIINKAREELGVSRSQGHPPQSIGGQARHTLTGTSTLTGTGKSQIQDKVKEVAERYIAQYRQDMEAFGIERADIEPRATEHIEDMISLIGGLIEKRYAYAVEGSVYFEIRKFSEYGKLSQQSLDQMISGVRTETDERKKDPLDFALWKKSKEDEPSWDSPWGKGRPGWHIECSAMSMKYLGENFDIHAGGRDLIFPHHENEIAQSESFSEKQFARYWMHNGLLTIRGEKMSKSLGNFISISDMVRTHSPDDIKIFFLQSHYRSPIDYTPEKVAQAKEARRKFLLRMYDKDGKLIDSLGKEKKIDNDNDKHSIDEMRKRFEGAMDDDFNTAVALGVLFDLVDLRDRIYRINSLAYEKKIILFNYATSTLWELCRVLGLALPELEEPISKEDASSLIQQRNEARRKGDFKRADAIRESFKNSGYQLEDFQDGATGILPI